MKIATVNTRGWHWALTDAAHQVKTGEILWLMRREKLDVLLLSDVHTASSGRFNTSHTTVALEEFVMIVGKMSSIILSPAAQAAWRETGYERWECKDTGRMVAVGLLIAGVKWRFVSVYAPDRVKPAWVKDLFLEEALHWRDELFATAGRREVQFWAGDWNAHIGRDAAGARGIGSHLLPSPTKEMGKKLLRWICEAAHDMLLIDSFRPSRKRGTFMNLNGLQRIWNELDVAMISEKAANTVNTVRTIDTNLSDHRAKVYGLSLPKKFKKSWRKIQARAREEKIKPIAVSRMRGRSEEAESKREEVATKIQEKIIEFSKCDHLEGEASGKEKVTRMMRILKQSAEEVVGREYTQKMAPFMDGHLDEMRKRTEEINDLFKSVLSAKSWPEKEKARKLRNSATASWRKTKRQWKSDWIKRVTVEMEVAMQRHDLGTFYRGLKELGIAYSDISQKGRVDHTPEQLKAHYSKLGSTPNVVRDEILDAITIKRPTDMSLANEPTEAEVKKEVSRMKDSAPGADEVTSSMLKLATSTKEGLIALTKSMCVVAYGSS